MKTKPKSNPLIRVGWLWIGASVAIIFQVNRAYGWGIPKNTTEWLGEIHIGMMMITGTVLIAVGQYLKSREE